MSKETVKTYKFVRNTVLLIGLGLSMFIPTFQKYGTEFHETNTIDVNYRNAVDSIRIERIANYPHHFAINK